MTETGTTNGSEIWSVDALLTKAQRYAEKMLAESRDDWEFALWSSLVLEFILRADLADYSPALLADNKSVNNLFSALGFESNAKKFIPKSIPTSEVIDRLAALDSQMFNSEVAGFCHRHAAQRNKELHSGQASFDGIKHSSWLGLYYKACEVLLNDLGRDLDFVFGAIEAATAKKLIAAQVDEAAKTVGATVAAYKKVWSEKSEPDRAKAAAIASLWATRHAGHRVNCPSCGSDAIVTGESISAPTKTIDGDLISEKQEHLPNRFECIACGMKIVGLSQLTAAGLGDVYVQTLSYDAGEYYAPPDDEWDSFEPDNNEPMD